MRFACRGLLFLLLLGCVSSGVLVQVAEVTQAPDFTAEALRAGGVAVFGHAGPMDELKRTALGTLDSQLAHLLKTSQRGLSVLGPASLHAEQVRSLRDQLLVESTDHLDFGRLAQLSRGQRYVLVANLNSNEVLRFEDEDEDSVSYCSRRVVRVHYRLLDLRTRGFAYRASIRKHDDNCRRNAHADPDLEDGLGGLLAAVLINTATSAAKGTYPKAPDPTQLLANAARDFVGTLPGAVERSR